MFHLLGWRSCISTSKRLARKKFSKSVHSWWQEMDQWGDTYKLFILPMIKDSLHSICWSSHAGFVETNFVVLWCFLVSGPPSGHSATQTSPCCLYFMLRQMGWCHSFLWQSQAALSLWLTVGQISQHLCVLCASVCMLGINVEKLAFSTICRRYFEWACIY